MHHLLQSIMYRVKGNPRTTVGGGVIGLVIAALISQIEEASGCHFAQAFDGVDWAQIIGFGVVQLFGALVTDGDKLSLSHMQQQKIAESS